MRSAIPAVLCFALIALTGGTPAAGQQKTPSTHQAPSSAPAAKTPAGSDQYAEESQAKAHCSSDTVVWVNRSSKIYHFHGYKDYGNTKNGAYMCEKEATAQSFRAAKDEKHP